MKKLTHLVQSFAVALATTAGVAIASDSSTLQVPFTNLGIDTNASAKLTSQFTAASSFVNVKAKNLTPGESYTFNVWEVAEFTGTANARGEWQVTFKAPKTRSSQLLDFDPRGQTVTLTQGTNILLSAVVSPAGETNSSLINEKIEIRASAGSGLAKLAFQQLKSGRQTFSLKLSKVTGTNWSFFVDGINRGNIPVRRGQGSVLFDTKPGKGSRLLDFEPRGKIVDIVSDETNLVFSGICEAQIKRVNVASPSLGLATIPSTGLDADGTAKAKLRVDKKARRKFSVEIEDVPEGSYEFLADSVLQGNIIVTSISGDTRGEIEFTSQDDDESELPLTFDPTNSVFTIRSGADVYFQGALVSAFGSGTNEPAGTLEESLTSTHLDADASGDAKYVIDDRGRRKFSVEIEDVPVGSYELRVGGVKRGTISASSKSGTVKGELEFSTSSDDAGELPLNFDPRGQLLEITNATGLFFSNLFGTGGDTNSVSTTPLRFKLPLFSTGAAAGATAEASFKRDENDKRSFEVEVEDVPAGNYDLSVGGVIRATITVTGVGSETRGQVEFSNESEAGKLNLDFDPLGQLVEITSGSTSYFGRVLPEN